MRECLPCLSIDTEQSYFLSYDICYDTKDGKSDKRNARGLIAFTNYELLRIVLDALSDIKCS